MISFVRDVFGFLRGKSTPFQIYSATKLAGILAFLPGFKEAPGLFLAASLLLLILNTNLFVAGLTGALGVLLGLALQPLSFEIGRFLIDGPASDVMTTLINAPVTAWFGFENYVATGGVVLGAIYGIIVGTVVVALLQRFRRGMAKLSASGEVENAISNPFVKASGWLFFGKVKGEPDWEVLAKRKFGKPVRILGVLLAVLVVGGAFAFPYVANEAWLARMVKARLEPLNGATVDLAGVVVDPAGGRLAVSGLALCDPNDLSRNTFEADRLEASLSGFDLLARKYALARLEVTGARVGESREEPGRRMGPPPRPAPVPGEAGGEEGDGDRSYTIDGVMKQAKQLKARLAEVKKWLGKITGSAEDEAAGEVAGETLEERLRRQAEELGHDRVFATHRIAEKPRFTVRELVIDKVTVEQLPGEVLSVRGKDLSTEAHLVEGTSVLKIDSASGRIGLELTFDRDSGPLSFHYSGLPVETVQGWMKSEDSFPFEGGHFDLKAAGTLSGGAVDVPVQVMAVESRLEVGGRSIKAPEVPFTLRVQGPLDNPRLRPDLRSLAGGLKDGVLDLGKSKVREKLEEKLGTPLNGILGGSREDVGEEGDEEEEKEGPARGALRDLLRRNR